MAATRSGLSVRNRYFLIFDIIIFVLSACFSFVIRLETFDLRPLGTGILVFLALSVPIRLLVFLLGGMYSRYWKNAGPSELLLVAYACLISGIAITGIVFVTTLLRPSVANLVPRSIPFIDLLLAAALVMGARFSLRAFQYTASNWSLRQHAIKQGANRALIIWAEKKGLKVFGVLTDGSRTVNP